jgi:hypothetical protein
VCWQWRRCRAGLERLSSAKEILALGKSTLINVSAGATNKWTNPALNAIHSAAIVRVQPNRICHWETLMEKLPRYSLAHDDKKKRWVLKTEPSGQAVKSFATKAAATKGGVLERAVGGKGSVRIKKRNGRIQEERTYPRSADPRGSKG